jgi:hypothetical protein
MDKKGRPQRTLEQQGVDADALFRWILLALPKRMSPKTRRVRGYFLTKSGKLSRAAELLGIADRAGRFQPVSEVSDAEVLRKETAGRAALYKALAGPRSQMAHIAIRCMTVDVLTLATGRQNYEAAARLLTKAYGCVYGKDFFVEPKALQKLVYAHRLEKSSKLTVFSADARRFLLPKIKLPN